MDLSVFIFTQQMGANIFFGTEVLFIIILNYLAIHGWAIDMIKVFL